MSPDAPTGAGAEPVVDLRTSTGGRLVARDVVRVAGPDAVTYLQGQLSQDVAAMAPGDVAWSFVLQPTGKVDAWVRLVRTADDEVVLDIEGGYGDAVLARLRRFLLRTKADVDRLDWRALAVRGPDAERVARAAAGGAGATADLVVPAGWSAIGGAAGAGGVDGFDVLGPEVVMPADVDEVSHTSFEAARIAAGVPAMGAELTEATIPAEVGQAVIDASVNFTKGCFTGQELVARIDSRGGNVPRRLRGLALPGAAPPVGSPVVVAGDEVGAVTSSAPAPGGGAVALAFVKRAVEPPAPAEVAGSPTTVVELPLPG